MDAGAVSGDEAAEVLDFLDDLASSTDSSSDDEVDSEGATAASGTSGSDGAAVAPPGAGASVSAHEVAGEKEKGEPAGSCEPEAEAILAEYCDHWTPLASKGAAGALRHSWHACETRLFRTRGALLTPHARRCVWCVCVWYVRVRVCVCVYVCGLCGWGGGALPSSAQ